MNTKMTVVLVIALLCSLTVPATAEETSTTIFLRLLSFDTKDGLPNIPEPYPQNYSPQETDYYILQFQGPVLQTWKDQVSATGAIIYDYLPDYSFVIRTEASNVSRLEGLHFVRWIGVYHPAFRIEPSLFTPETRDEIIESEKPLKLRASLSKDEDLGVLATHFTQEGAEILEKIESRSNNIIIFLVPKATYQDIVKRLAAIKGVFWVERVLPFYLNNRDSAWIGQSWTQGKMPIWEHGIYGQGQIVGVADTGVDVDHCFFYDQNAPLPGGFVNHRHRKVIQYIDLVGNGDWDDHSHGTHTAGSVLGDRGTWGVGDEYDGMAPAAKLIFHDCGRGRSQSLEGLPNDLKQLFNPTYLNGARLHSNSWGGGSNGYTMNSRQVDEFIWTHQDYLVFFSAGNAGPQPHTVNEPSTAKNCVSVGATYPALGADNMVGFSSRGPTEDNRLKPDVTVPGVVASALTDRNINTYNCGLATFSGTSMSCPIAAGLAALARTYYTAGFYPRGIEDGNFAINPSGALIKATLINSARSMLNSTDVPSFDQGWGRILLEDSLFFSGDKRDLQVYDSYPDGLDTGDKDEYQFIVISDDIPFKVVLVWSDAPSTTGAARNLVNNLNLKAIDVENNTYLGNHFSGGYSTTGGQPDTLNNVEVVFLEAPKLGLYTIRVEGANVPQGPQPYALVVSGDLGLSMGTVSLNKDTYGCQDSIHVVLTDADLKGNLTQTVNIHSDTETQSETITLNENPADSGIFTESISTDTGTPVNDGVLQVAASDKITVEYVDQDDGFGHLNQIVTARATADCTAPFITDVQFTPVSDTEVVVTWRTDELSDSRVNYGDVTPLSETVSNANMVKDHRLTLSNLTPCTVYKAELQSTDISTNTRIDDNSGVYYEFQLPQELLDYEESFEGTAHGWTAGGDWNISYVRVFSGSRSFYSGKDNQQSNRLVSPPIQLVSGLTSILTFWTAYDFEKSWDGGIIEISPDAGATWAKLYPREDYPDSSNSDTDSCLGNFQPVFSGEALSWTKYTVDLSQYEGQEVQVAFTYCSDQALTEEGWYVDDVKISRYQMCSSDVEIMSYHLTDSQSTCTDNDDYPDAGETIDITVELINRGAQDSGPVDVTLSTQSQYLTITQSSFSTTNLIANGGSASADFSLELDTNIPCDETAIVTLETVCAGDMTQFTMPLELNRDVNHANGIWTENLFIEPTDWTIDGLWQADSDRTMSPGYSWFSGSNDNLCAKLISPPVKVASRGNPRLTFWTRYSFEANWDGGFVQISDNGGLTWSKLNPVGGYPDDTNSRTSSCIGKTTNCFTGRSQGWEFYTFQLDAYKGEEVSFAFMVGNDGRDNREGWYIDDIALFDAEMVTSLCDQTPCDVGDTTPPTVPVVSDLLDNSNSDKNLVFTCSADDPESGILKYCYAIGKSQQVPDAFGWIDGGDTTLFKVRSAKFENYEDYFVTVYAVNNEGLWSEPGISDGVFIDLVSTTTTITSPQDSAIITDSEVTIEGTCSDGLGTGVDYVEISFDLGTTWNTVAGKLSWSYIWQVPGAGDYNICVRGIDNAGNVEEPAAMISVHVPAQNATDILAGGYWDTRLTSAAGGHIRLMIFTDDVSGALQMELLSGGQSTGIYLSDDGTNGDWSTQDGIYTLYLPGIAPGLLPMELLFEVSDTGTATSTDVWPYLVVE